MEDSCVEDYSDWAEFKLVYVDQLTYEEQRPPPPSYDEALVHLLQQGSSPYVSMGGTFRKDAWTSTQEDLRVTNGGPTEEKIDIYEGLLSLDKSKSIGNLTVAEIQPKRIIGLPTTGRYRKKYKGPPLIFECDVCGKEHKQMAMLARHLTVHNGDLQCPVGGCKAVYGHKTSLTNHLRRHHNLPKQKRCLSDDC